MKIVRSYLIPYVGKLDIVDNRSDLDSQKNHGDFYAKCPRFGDLGRFSRTPEEAESGARKEIGMYLSKERRKLESEFAGMITLERVIIIDQENWLKRYLDTQSNSSENKSEGGN